MMKRIICIGMILCTCLFSACDSFHWGSSTHIERNKEILYEKGLLILEAVENKDFTILEEIMSVYALETEDITDGFEYSCELLDSPIVTHEMLGTPIGKHYEGWKEYMKGRATFYFTTESGKEYSLYFEYYYYNDFDESFVGVDRIKFTDESEVDENYVPGRLYERSGIYNPQWDLTDQPT